MTTERYTFQAVGASDVVSAYRSIQRESVRTATAVERTESRSAARRARGTKSSEERRWREVEQYSRKIERTFEREARAAERAEQRRARAAETANRKIARDRARTLSRVGGALTSAGLGAAATGMGAAVGVVGVAARQELGLNKRINQIRANARLAGEADPGEVALRRRFSAFARSTPGQTADSAAAATEAFQSKTGQVLDTDRLKVLGNIASATGADMSDLASAAAALQRSFGISTLDDFTDSLAGLAEQGARGAFEIKDMASLMDRMAAAAQGKFAGGTEGVRQLGGLMQLARTTTGSSEEAATVIENMMMQMVAKSGDLKAMGVDVFTDETQTKMRDPMEVIKDFLKESGGDIQKQGEIFAIRGQRGVNPLGQTYADAYKSATGTEEQKVAAALDAVDKQFEGFASSVGGYSLIQDIAADQQASASAQLDAAWEEIRSSVSTQLMPALLDLAKKAPEFAAALEVAIGVLGVFAEWVGYATEALEDLGIISKRDKNHALSAQEAQEGLDQIDKDMAKNMATPNGWFGQLGHGVARGVSGLTGGNDAFATDAQRKRINELAKQLHDGTAKGFMSGESAMSADAALGAGSFAAADAFIGASGASAAQKKAVRESLKSGDLFNSDQNFYMLSSRLDDLQNALGGGELTGTQIALREGINNRSNADMFAHGLRDEADPLRQKQIATAGMSGMTDKSAAEFNAQIKESAGFFGKVMAEAAAEFRNSASIIAAEP